VGGIGREALHPHHAGADAGDHLVQRVRQIVELIPVPGGRNRLLEVRPGNAAGGQVDLLDGPQAPARQPGSEHRRQEQENRKRVEVDVPDGPGIADEAPGVKGPLDEGIPRRHLHDQIGVAASKIRLVRDSLAAAEFAGESEILAGERPSPEKHPALHVEDLHTEPEIGLGDGDVAFDDVSHRGSGRPGIPDRVGDLLHL
jgi:hypothetical protein